MTYRDHSKKRMLEKNITQKEIGVDRKSVV